MLQKWIFEKPKLVVIILGAIVYLNSLFNGFVWDDETQIINNGLVHSISNLPTFFAGSTFGTGGAGGLGGIYYKPLMSTTFSLIYTIFGQNAFFFHLVQVSLHIANAYLVYLLFKSFIRPQLSLLLSIIFLVHPFNSESVVYISAMQDVLFTFFGLVALSFLIKGIKTLKEYLLVFGLLLCSMLSKETGVVFVFSAFVFTFIFKKAHALKHLLGTTLVFSVYFLLRFGVANVPFTTQHLSPITRVDFVTRLLTLPKIFYFYISSFVFPKDLTIDQQWIVNKISFYDFYLPLVVLLFTGLLIFGYLLYLIKVKDGVRVKPYLFFLSIFVLGLGAHLQIFPLDMTVADRWFYLPMIGLLGISGIVGERRIRGIGGIRGSRAVGILIVLVFVLSARTIARNFQWKDGLTLFSNDIKVSQNSFDLENNLGVELFRKGDFEGAKIHFQKSTEIAPYWWSNWNGLGAIAEREKNYELALTYYQKSIDNGTDSLAYENKANLLYSMDKKKDSLVFTKEAIKKLPYNPRLWLIMALSAYELQEKETALTAAKNLYTLSPSDQTYYIYSTILQGKKLELVR